MREFGGGNKPITPTYVCVQEYLIPDIYDFSWRHRTYSFGLKTSVIGHHPYWKFDGCHNGRVIRRSIHNLPRFGRIKHKFSRKYTVSIISYNWCHFVKAHATHNTHRHIHHKRKKWFLKFEKKKNLFITKGKWKIYCLGIVSGAKKIITTLWPTNRWTAISKSRRLTNVILYMSSKKTRTAT